MEEGGPSLGWTVQWASNYPPYGTADRCPKCRSAFIGTAFQRQIIPDEENKIVMLTERFERSCERCDFKWFEAVKELG